MANKTGSVKTKTTRTTFYRLSKNWHKQGPGVTVYEPPALWKKFVEFVEYCEKTPFETELYFNSKDGVRSQTANKLRALTINGFCIYAGIARRTYYHYKEMEKFKDVMGMIDDIIFDQKFQAAAAGLIDPFLIGKDLGLVDKKELSGNLGIGITVKDLTDEDVNQDTDSLTDN